MSSRPPIKKSYDQLQEILTEAERVNTVLVNDYTTLKARDRQMSTELEEAKRKCAEATEEANRLIPLYDNEVVKRTMCEQRLEELRTQVEESEGLLYDQISKCKELEAAQQDSEQKIANLEDMLATEKQKVTVLKRKEEEHDLKVENVREERDHFINLLTQTKSELASTRAEVCDAESRMEEMNKLFELEQINRIKIEAQLEQLQMHRMNLEKQRSSQESLNEQLTAERQRTTNLEKEKAELEKKIHEKESTIEDLHGKLLSEIDKRAAMEEQMESDMENLKRDKTHAETTMHKMEVMLEEANKLYQEMERQCEDAQTKLKALESVHARVAAERDELSESLARERDQNKEANDREQDLYKKLQASENNVLDMRNKLRQMEEEVEQTRRKGFSSLLANSQNGIENTNHDENASENGGGDSENGDISGATIPPEWRQQIEEEKRRVEQAYASLDEERKSLKAELQASENERRLFMEDLQRITEEKAVLMQKTTAFLMERKNMEEERKKWQEEKEKIAEAQTAAAEDQKAIDNELRKLVEQRLELQESNRQLEEKEALVLELQGKLKELEAKLTAEHKQNEMLELKLSSTAVPAPTTPVQEPRQSKFSIFMSPKPKENVHTSQATSDEERKKLLFDEYGILLTDLNTALFQKREALNELENKDGNKFLRKLPIASAKTAISKLEHLQEKIKKSLRNVDEKVGVTVAEEGVEYANLKSLKSELESV